MGGCRRGPRAEKVKESRLQGETGEAHLEDVVIPSPALPVSEMSPSPAVAVTPPHW